MTTEEVYKALKAPFSEHHTDVRGGVDIVYITGEQCASRLNETLGFDGWNFRVLHQETHTESDEIWVLGQLDVEINGKHIIKEQFGSQKIKRSRSTGAPLDIGFEFKGAATDAMKKCASLIGVGLYLSYKPANRQPQRGQRPTTPRQTPEHRPEPPSKPAVIVCQVCGGEVTDHAETPRHVIATESNKQFRKTMCWDCLQKATV